MKRLLCLLPALVMALNCASAVKPYPSEKRYLIAVMNFHLKTPSDVHNEKLEALNREKMTGMLLESGRVRIAEREKIDKILQEQKLGQTGLIDENTASRIGKLAGVDAVLFGDITPLKTGNVKQSEVRKAVVEMTITGKLVNTTTGEIIATAVKTGKDTVPLMRGTRKVVKMKLKPLMDRLVTEFTGSLIEKIPAKP